MLSLGDNRGLVVKTRDSTTEPSSVQIETQYFDIVVGAREGEIWARIRSRPAFEVACLSMAESEPSVILMKKKHFPDEPDFMRLPGGYLRGAHDTYIPKKIKEDTGIELSFANLVKFGQVIGHPEIKTPIDLYYTFGWQERRAAREGVQVFQLPLFEATRVAMQGRVASDSTFSALMRLYWLWKEGELLRER